jgi:hypothetical protein
MRTVVLSCLMSGAVLVQSSYASDDSQVRELVDQTLPWLIGEFDKRGFLVS